MENRLSSLLLFVCLLLSAACTQKEPLPVEVPGSEIKLILDAQIDRWDVGGTKAEGTSEWKNGDRIHFLISGPDGRKSHAEAYYIAESDFWSIQFLDWRNYSGSWQITQVDLDLAGATSGTCEAYCFFDNAGNDYTMRERLEDGTSCLNFTSTIAIYRDEAARYAYYPDNQTIIVKAHLTPMSGRIRFAKPLSGGDDWYNVAVYGLQHYTRLNLDTFEWTTTSGLAEANIDGGRDFSEYIYGSFPDPDRRVLTVADKKYGDPDFFERSFTEDIMAPGSSNWSYLPVSDSHNEWYRYENGFGGWNFGVEDLRMLYVVPGTFMMGGDDAGPVHQVTLTQGYYLSQTEITKDMWYRIMGEPSDYANTGVPVTGKSWDEVQEFIAALNTKSGYSFRLPTEAEWEFAARGGLQSKGYKYSGSDNFADVAVRDGNWSMQATKTRNPNEWNFYDMSGNAAEWVNDWFGPYPSTAVVDPKGPDSGTEHITRGGSRGRDSSQLTVSYRDHNPELGLTGFRLALDASKIR